MKPAISFENLSKQYALGERAPYQTLRESITNSTARAWNKLGRLWPLGRKAPAHGNTQGQGKTGEFWALRDVSAEIQPGEVVGLIGRNGAGKSTLLKILSRITAPTRGRVVLRGRVGSLLEVGTGFHHELTGRENIYLSGAILGMTRREITRKFDAIVAFAEIGQFLDTPVKRYSSGMYVRLAFAVAAHLEPEILLVDEVLAVGDTAFQNKCVGKMNEVTEAGRTIIFVSHNLAMIQNLCTRAYLLKQGRITTEGPPRQVIDAYLNENLDSIKTSLEERTDRTGSGEIIITAIETLDGKGAPCPVPTSGQDLILRMHYQSKLPKVFANCRMSLSVHKEEHVYFLLSTELVSRQPLNLQGTGYLDFIVPELPLSAGEYYLNPFIESNGVIQDWVIGAARLSVVDADFYGTGRNYPAGWKGRCVLVKHRWNHFGLNSPVPGS